MGRTLGLAAAVLMAATGCTVSGLYLLDTPESNPLEVEILPETLMSGEMPISVDPRIELMCILQYLTGEDPICDSGQFPFPYEYKLAIEDWFGEYAGHSSVVQYKRFLDRGFSFDGPPTAALTLDYDLSPLELEEYPAYLIERLGGEKGLLMLYQFLQDFARDTDFAGFFDSQRSFYQELLLDVQTKLGAHDYAAELTAYAGVESELDFAMVLLPLANGPNFGPSVHPAGQTERLYSIISQAFRADPPGFPEGRALRALVRHEFGHSISNELIDANGELVDSYEALFEPIRDAMASQSYGSWRTAMYEHMVRAITIRLAAADSAEDGQARRDYEYYRGFIYVDELLAGLEELEAARATDDSVTLGDRMGAIIRRLDPYLQ